MSLLFPASAELLASLDCDTDPPPPPYPTDVGALVFDWSLYTSAPADCSVELSTVASWLWSAPDASPSMAIAEDPWPWVTYWSVMLSLPAAAELSAEFD